MPQLWGRQLYNYSEPDSEGDLINYHRIDEECPYWVFAPIRKINDSKDIESDPNYLNIGKQYNLLCKRRYANSFQMYNRRFINEIQLLATHSLTAMDSAHIIRHMSYTSLWPPLHSRKEIDKSRKVMYSLKSTQRRRLNNLMSCEIN